jgi:molybdopterin-guanine dinucleotide biosynthesis protein A
LLDTPCVILAGGKSSRMGKDKSLLPFGGFDTLCEYQYQKYKKIFNEVFISTKSDKFSFKANFIYDESEIFAPIVAISKILEKFESFFLVGVDIPFLKSDDIIGIVKKNDDVVVAKSALGIEPMIGKYSRGIKDKINRAIEEENFRLQDLLKEAKTYFIDDLDSLLNLNRPSDYEKARKLYG